MGVRRVPTGNTAREFGLGELRQLSAADVAALGEALIITNKATGEKVAALVPYDEYLRMQDRLDGRKPIAQDGFPMIRSGNP